MPDKAPKPKHFLDLEYIDSASLRGMLERSASFKRGEAAELPLAGKALVMIFEKPSTRTRVSFEMAIRQLGGEAVRVLRSDFTIASCESRKLSS